uniref:Vacuolar protein sorting-associated protein 13D n=1 Tax=Daphnia magna TaxID=35525 RepID=A0A0P6FFD1_9CRUS
MLERLVAWFCNNYLGRYLENLNTDQLSVALLQGEVELENVPLKRDILDQLGLPLQIHAGFVGKISFQIPLRKIRSEPWVISFEQLYLVAGPKDKNEPYNEESEENGALERKMAALDLMEAEWRSENDPQGLSSSSLYSLTYSSWLSYGASLVTNIVQNIQLRIKDIHIRYEDGISCPGKVFACGVRVDSLTAQTCDESWVPKFMPATSQGLMYKLLELDGLAVYWDTNTELFANLPLDVLSSKLMQPCSIERNEFLLAPVSGYAHLKRNCNVKPLRSLNQPRVACDFQLDRVNIEIRDVQYHQLVQCCRSLELLARGLQFRRWRVDSEVQSHPHPRRQWRFSVNCIIAEIRKKNQSRNWPFVIRRAKEIVLYVQSFKEHLLNPIGSTAESKLQRERIESELELQELQVLRSIAMQQIAKSQSKNESVFNDAATGNSSLFQRWFSSWWSAEESTNGNEQSANEDRVEHEILETLEDAMRDNTVRQRDILPLQFSSTLKQGLIRLSTCHRTETGQSWSTLLEIEFDNVLQEWESRPRLKSNKFHLSLGNVWVRDCSTAASLFPLIVSPQRKDARPFKSFAGMGSLLPGFNLPFFRSSPSSPNLNVSQDEAPLFDFVYERHPPGSNWDHRLKITSLAIECVYNHSLFQKIIELYSVPHNTTEERSVLGQRLRQAALSGFEAVKQKTKESLTQSLTPSSVNLSSKQQSWDLLINISAPHILIPESVGSRDSLLMIIDFGHFHVTRSIVNCIAAELETTTRNGNEDDDDEQYITPCSTPPNESAVTTPLDDAHDMNSFMSGNKECNDLSDKYNVHFSDLQLLVCRVKDNWKQAHLKGTSALHLLDRFSILIHVEKYGRLVPGLEKPFLTLTASLPHLVAHINEPKIHALLSVSKQFRSNVVPTPVYETASEDGDTDETDASLAETEKSEEHWFMAQFNIEQLSVEVQSRGRSVAELQVGGVQASYSMRPTDSSVHLAVHSLLLVDAMQTLGSDYELLIASHKHVSMDSMSGSLKESEPTSPVSPSSPDPSSHKGQRATSPVSLAQALTSLQTDPSWRKDGLSPPMARHRMATSALKSEALILIDIVTVEPTWVDGKAEGRIRIIKVHFNSLDVIANQDTVVELASFFQRVMPKKTMPSNPDESNFSTGLPSNHSRFPPFALVPDGSTDITFDFHRLTILLLRSVVKEEMLIGRKVATLTVTEAHISGNLASDVLVQGSLGGLQVLDLTPEGQKHQRVVSVGHDPLVEQHQNLYMLVSQGLYDTTKDKNEVKAFSFKFLQPGLEAPGEEEEGYKLSLEIRMASLCYSHSVHFLAEVAACVSEFKQSVSNMAMSLKLTAAEMAVDLLHRGTEGLAQSIYISGSTSVTEGLSLNAMKEANDEEQPSPPSRVRLSALLESPILVLPKSAKSPQVLVAHLGQIEISNDIKVETEHPPQLSEELSGGTHKEHFEVEVRDMSLYSLNVDEKWKSSFSHFYTGPSAFLRITAQELYSCASPHGRPILHDTLLKFSLHRIVDRPILSDADPFLFPLTDFYPKLEVCDVFQVHGCVVSPLQVSLSKDQYQQIIQSLDNLNWNKVDASSNFEAGPDPSTKNRAPARVKQRELILNLKFQLPRFSMQLLDNSNRAIVSLSFEDFLVAYEQNCTFSATVQTSLKSLILEDLMVKEDSKYRRLVASNDRQSDRIAGRLNLSSFMSSSCPDLRAQGLYNPGSRSLPARLESDKSQWKSSVRAKAPQKKPIAKCPSTPPSSSSMMYHQRFTRSGVGDNNLVFIKILLVDPDSPDFALKYNSTHRFIEINFNALDVIINLESWVMVLDFFGTSTTKVSRQQKKKVAASSPGYQDWSKMANAHTVNARWEVEVRSFSLLLNRKDYEVAEATISNLTWEMASMRGNLDVTGKLGSITVQDLTSAGKMYRERFITSGNEALDFQFFCFSADDPQLARDYDIRLNLNMASVLYVHTQRFYTECFSMLEQFQELRRVAGTFGATGQSGAASVSRKPWRHGTRILLNVEAGSPVILVPICSTSEHLLVIDLGRISVSNKFVVTDGSVCVPTINKSRKAGLKGLPVVPITANPETVLVDVIQVELSNMDLCTGQRQKANRSQVGDLILGSYLIRRSGQSLLKDTCEMKLEVRRNLDSHLKHPVPDMDLCGLLSTVQCSVDEHQYKLVRGLLAFNLGEPVDFLHSDQPPPTSPIQLPDDSKPPMWAKLKIHIDLVDVMLEVKDSRIGAFSTIKFIDSRLVYESNSDGSKDVDLVSQQVVIRDTRYDASSATHSATKKNVFTQILEPVTKARREGSLQAEVHYRSTEDFTRFTVVLNNMRLLAVVDWWTLFREFLLHSPDEYRGTNNDKGRNSEESDVKPHAKWTATSTRPSPIIVSTGVISKRAALIDTRKVPVEFKINISDSEVVIIEDTSVRDSSAVILKGTALLTYRPQIHSKPLSCQLNRVEIFSSQLNLEEETALSIVDPATISIEIVDKSSATDVKGILDATSSDLHQILEVQAQQIILRLSYNDMKLFMRILDSLPHQARLTSAESTIVNEINKLKALGFSTDDCQTALRSCNDNLEEAALWLTQNASTVTGQRQPEMAEIQIRGIEIRTGCVSLCVIDDCRDADLPLAEITTSQLLLRQSIDVAQMTGEGTLTCQFAIDYYNRVLSGWEPFVEPFKCHVHWNFLAFNGSIANRPSQSIFFDTEDVVNLTCTRALLELFGTVKRNWMEDYYGQNNKELSSLGDGSSVVRQRSPFVPFALHNATGSKIKFRTLTASLLTEGAPSAASTKSSRWIHCEAGDVVAFSFENRGKLRHHDSHQTQTHQLSIELDGWMEFGPVSVDRVGVYFRYASVHSSPSRRNTAAVERDLERVLVVIAVTLEGSARRLVTVRSALQVTNNLEETVELRLEPPAFNLHPSKTVRVPPCTTYPIPMSYLMSQIFVRPMAEKLPHAFSFCKDPIEWHAPTQTTANIRQCNPVISNQDLTYRFAVDIHRENFPPEKINTDDSEWTAQPAHTITLLSPLVVVNLLPYELLWELKAVGQSGIIKPGKSTSIHTVNVSAGFQIAFRTENFVHSSDLVIGTSPHNFSTRLRLYDSANRLLLLQVKISSKAPGSVKLSISAPYWLVNKAGIPLIFRQEGVQQEAAGQFDEHEMARSLSPMLFSFTDREASHSLTARIGTGLHLGCKPHWCQHFPLQKGVRVRSFLVSPRDGRPELVYLVGISIRSGRGRYRDTQIVTLAPCYQLYNQSSWTLEVSQAYFATTFTDPGAQSTYLNLVPGCHLPFHWPRLDKDQLLCVRLLDVKNCHWSGGFAIQNISSFHINIRDGESRANFLRVEIFQQECTFCVVFSDATGFPPPLRVDNLALVPIIFHQSDVPEAYLHTTVRPGSSMPYVFDEPTKPARLNIIAPGGASSSYDMTTLKEGSQLTYENFIYVCLTVTFNGDDMSTGNALDPNNVELVLDVPEGTRVVLSGKETGKRSQLWRMTGSGMLQHEGSSPPRDPSNPQVDPSRILVLDIAGPALQPSEFVHLMLRKPDPRRQLTQTWHFTEDGRLCCGHSNVFVQAKDGFYGIRQGNDVVLGPAQSVTYYRLPSGIPAEQAIHWQRLRPGSGCLSVKTIMDGPTRVLQVADFLNKPSHCHSNENSVTASTDAEKTSNKQLKVEMKFKGGLGLSIVNHSPPEELAYCRLSNISLELITGDGTLSIDASVQSIQIDDSLQDPHCPVVVYVSPSVNQDESKDMPALRLTVHRQLTSRLNADIFKNLIVTFKNLTINIEENQLFKLLAFAGFNQSDLELERIDESEYESQRSLNAATSIDAKRYYFGILKLVLEQVRLSVYTSSKLPPELKAIKRKLGLTLIKFEDANIELHPFIRSHPFETAQLIIDSVVKHYKDELKSQAARILGSTDFLGNPLGFVNDVSEGVSGFLYEGNVGGLVQNVTFGLSNSAAKVTGSLSDGLGRVTMDERHEEVRQRLLKHTGQSSDHLVAGLKGFGFGILGGMTSIFTQTYEGISNEGLGGLFTGFGKGLVGTVTKPAVGVLDLATGAASAVRDSSRSSSREIPRRIRPPRLVIGPGGIVPRYSEKQGRGQELLFQLNRHEYRETFIAYEALGSLPESLHMLISSEHIRVFSMNSPNKEVVLDIHLSELQSCKSVVIKDFGTQSTAHYYVELSLLLEPDNPLGARRPQVRCDSESLAKRVTQEINYAKSVYEENRHSLISSPKFSP